MAVPFAILTVVGGINVTESARLAGDNYKTRSILLTEAVATLLLFMLNTALTAGLTIVQARGAESERFGFVFTTLGRVTGELVTVLFSVSLFFVIYKYASVRRLPWRSALLAASFTAVAFELAKRLYAL